ncbi:hypothetical protein LTR36_002571 [Oleoguttula mirabilis]|uniref:Uncharacterized protein n=1 Tax=Oleoguttula mirabilis TaxID=1507867 RepID=A0AAV9JKB8_9PEZI|nr:hypothetical protein LTR36_002571 [Oleoguttula mirabilis]
MASKELYDKLTATAKEFVLSTSPKKAGTNEADPDRFLKTITSDFKMSWGHKFFVTTKPGLQGEISGQDFVEHQGKMVSALETWDIVPTSLCVDVEKKSVVLRADFFMVAPGQEKLLNDIIFWITMDESGGKVKDAKEFIDPVASAELAERMKSGTGNDTTPNPADADKGTNPGQ